jgi:hypothetical protein
MRSSFPIAIIVLSLFLSCHPTRKIPLETKDDPTIITTDKILAAKPGFSGYFPTSYILGDTSYIRIVCNRNTMEKVWMVYYDVEDHKWNTITWIGSGENNKIIGDTIFTRRNGVKGGRMTDDAPEFYVAASNDNGKTWEAQHNYQTFYRCKNAKTNRSFLTTILVSNDYMNESGRPSVAVIIQNKKQSNFTSKQIEKNHNFDFLCPVTREF